MKLLSLTQFNEFTSTKDFDIGMIAMTFHGTALLNSAQGLPLFGMYVQGSDGTAAAGVTVGATVYPVLSTGVWTGVVNNDESDALGQETGIGPLANTTALTTTTADYFGFVQTGGLGFSAQTLLTTDSAAGHWIYGATTNGLISSVLGNLTTQGCPTGAWGLTYLASTALAQAARTYMVSSQLFNLPLTI